MIEIDLTEYQIFSSTFFLPYCVSSALILECLFIAQATMIHPKEG